MATPNPETNAPRRWWRFPIRRVPLIACVAILLIPLAAGAWVQSQRAAEEKVLSRAAAQMEQGRWEAARTTLNELRSRRFLSGSARHQGAALYFRLGEDRTAHTLLGPTRFDASDPRDVRLRDLAARCQRASALVKKSETATQPQDRLRLLREAQDELPESPHLLQRVVREELSAMLNGEETDPQETARFEEDYTQLRIAAPELAAEVRSEITALTGRMGTAVN